MTRHIYVTRHGCGGNHHHRVGHNHHIHHNHHHHHHQRLHLQVEKGMVVVAIIMEQRIMEEVTMVAMEVVK